MNTLNHSSNLHQKSPENLTHSSNNERLSTLEPSTVNPTLTNLLDSHPQTGLNVHLDWVQGYLKTSHFDSLLSTLNKYFSSDQILRSETPVLEPHLKVIDTRFKDKPILVQYKLVKDSEGLVIEREYTLVIKGQALSRLPLEKQYLLCFELYYLYGFSCTRIDIAIDDYDKTVNRKDIVKALKSKDYSGFTKSRGFDNYDKPEDGQAETIYLGSPKSDKLVRFYNAEGVHGIPADRWELELREKNAQNLLVSFVKNDPETSTEIAKPLIDYFLSSLSFVNRTNKNGKRERNVARCSVLPWWKKFTKKLSNY